MGRTSPDRETEYIYQTSLKEAEKIGASHGRAEEFTLSEKEKIREHQGRMRKILERRSNENRRKVAYIKGSNDPGVQRERYEELRRGGLMR